MKLKLLLPGLLLAVAAGCGPNAVPSSTTTLPAQNPGVTNYDARGVIQQVAPDRRSATIKHEKISGYMRAMTMDFPVKDTNELNNLGPDDEITFQLAVTDTNDWIQNLHFVAHHIGAVTNDVFTFHEATAELKPGDVLPDYEFTGEDGRLFHFSDFRGGAVAFTFFYTSCPLPDYCPRMNRNLAEARKLIRAQTNAPANWQMLSISFDSDFDKPEMLSGYGNFYRAGDTNRWLFAVASTNTLAGLAPAVDLHFWREAGTISHNLRTVVLDGSGKIYCQFDGNDWTPEALADAIIKAAQVK
jgi:protein SCO1/2